MHVTQFTAAITLVATALITPLVSAQTPASATRELGIKYVRESAEYAALTRQVYRIAANVVPARQTTGDPWVVVLDVDETALDNSTYQVERAVYGLPYDTPSWNGWVLRHAAPAVPGAVEFVQRVRAAGGHIAWITNREAATASADATRDNLRQVGLWTDDDRLCGQKSREHTKAMRRQEVAGGSGDCAWPGVKMRIAALVGDQMSDFPTPSEQLPVTGNDADFGTTCFLLPNPMYGGWTTAVTRP